MKIDFDREEALRLLRLATFEKRAIAPAATGNRGGSNPPQEAKLLQVRAAGAGGGSNSQNWAQTGTDNLNALFTVKTTVPPAKTPSVKASIKTPSFASMGTGGGGRSGGVGGMKGAPSVGGTTEGKQLSVAPMVKTNSADMDKEAQLLQGALRMGAHLTPKLVSRFINKAPSLMKGTSKIPQGSMLKRLGQKDLVAMANRASNPNILQRVTGRIGTPKYRGGRSEARFDISNKARQELHRRYLRKRPAGHQGSDSHAQFVESMGGRLMPPSGVIEKGTRGTIPHWDPTKQMALKADDFMGKRFNPKKPARSLYAEVGRAFPKGVETSKGTVIPGTARPGKARVRKQVQKDIGTPTRTKADKAYDEVGNEIKTPGVFKRFFGAGGREWRKAPPDTFGGDAFRRVRGTGRWGGGALGAGAIHSRFTSPFQQRYKTKMVGGKRVVTRDDMGNPVLENILDAQGKPMRRDWFGEQGHFATAAPLAAAVGTARFPGFFLGGAPGLAGGEAMYRSFKGVPKNIANKKITGYNSKTKEPIFEEDALPSMGVRSQQQMGQYGKGLSSVGSSTANLFRGGGGKSALTPEQWASLRKGAQPELRRHGWIK